MILADSVSDRLVAEYRATFGDWLFPTPAGEAPLGLHWCLAQPAPQTDELGPDGHGPRAHDVDMADYPRRIWVGGEALFLAPLRLGDRVTRKTTLLPLAYKRGHAGPICLTGAAHDLGNAAGPIVRERQDIAFRGPAAGPEPVRPAFVAPIETGDMAWELATPPTLLFRYSALTFNSHRIHYDRRYAHDIEGYPDLVVHGPLQATVLLNLAASLLGRAPARLAYRATAALYAGSGAVAVARAAGDGAVLTMQAADGTVTMRAEAA